MLLLPRYVFEFKSGGNPHETADIKAIFILQITSQIPNLKAQKLHMR